MVTKLLLLDEVTVPTYVHGAPLWDSSETKEPSCGYSLQTSGYLGEVKGLSIHNQKEGRVSSSAHRYTALQ